MLVDLAILIVVEVAVQAAGARGDLVDAAFAQLVDVFGIDGQRAGHQEEVHLAVLDRVVEHLGRMRRIHVGNAAARDGDGLLDLLDDVEQHAAAGVVGDQLALPVAGEVKLGAVGAGALDAVAGEVQVGRELADVHAQRSKAQMQGARAGVLQHLADFAVFFDGGEQGAVADVHVVLFDDVDEDLDREVRAAFLLDAADDLSNKAGAVFEALRAVLVVTMVSHAGEERLADVVAGGVDFHRVKADALEIHGSGDKVVLQVLDLFAGQMLGAGRLVLRSGRRVKAAELLAHAGELVAHVAARIVHSLDELGQRLGRRILLAGVEIMRIQLQEVFHPDHFHAALGERLVVGDELFLGAHGVRAGSGLHHAVIELQAAELPAGEDRSHVGILAAVIVILRVELGHRLLRGQLRLSLGLHLNARRQANRSQAHRAGGGALQKVSAGNLCHTNPPYKYTVWSYLPDYLYLNIHGFSLAISFPYTTYARNALPFD